jgi:transcriptional regulator GlxA family with amidase domain
MPHSQHDTRQIVVIGFDGAQSLDLVGPMEVFTAANFHSRTRYPPYSVTLASVTGRDIVANAGFRLAGATALKMVPDDLDTIVVAGGSEAGLRHAIAATDLVSWLRLRATRTRRVASVCTGAFVLAAAGFLDGRRATTHWNSCALLHELWPAVVVEPDAIFIADPPFYTSAGVTAGIDLCLSLVEADCGPEIALAVAKQLVLFMRRPGGQSQFSACLTVQPSATPRLRALIAAIVENPAVDLSGPALAALAGMSERTFSRVFRKEIGLTPAHFVEVVRVDRAKALLETSDWPLARVAERAGFGSKDALHRAFLRHVGTAPGAYRERFGAIT